MSGAEVICNLGDRSQEGSACHAHPIVVAQRLRGAQNGVAGALLRTVPGTGLGGSVALQEAADAGPGTWPKKLQVDAKVTLLAFWVGSKGWIYCCLLLLGTPATSAREGGPAVFAKPEGQRRTAEPATVVAGPLRAADRPRPGAAEERPTPAAAARTEMHTLLNPPPPRPTLPRRRPRRAGDALTASRWSPAEASAAHNAPRAAISLPPSPARLALCGPHANTVWVGGSAGAGPRGLRRARPALLSVAPRTSDF